MLCLRDRMYLLIGQVALSFWPVIFVDQSKESRGGEDNTQRRLTSSERQASRKKQKDVKKGEPSQNRGVAV